MFVSFIVWCYYNFHSCIVLVLYLKDFIVIIIIIIIIII